MFQFQGLKDLDYIIQEKSVVEYVFDFEFDSNVTQSEFIFVNPMITRLVSGG